MDFDFTTHISKVLSITPSKITIQPLTGGTLNVAVRASFTPPLDLTQFGHPQSVSSVILKYSPPYMASEPDVPLDTVRQDIEASALILLDPNSESALPVSSLFAKYPNIRIPRLIHYDHEEHVLIITDLGSSIVKIDNWLTQDPPPNTEDVERIAKDLGRFIADFVIATIEPDVELLSLFPSNLGLMNQFDIYLVNNLKVVFQSHGVSDAEILIKRVEDAARDRSQTNLCLGMVDLWRNNIFIDPDKNICLIDWEYFGLSNASCEMSLLVQTMHWILLNSSFTDAAKKCATTFISTMLRSYGQVRADIPSPDFRRQALIAYGREALSLIKSSPDEFDDSMKQRSLESGLTYLRAAGESVDSMDVSVFDSENVMMTPYESLYEKAREILAAQ